MIWIFILVGIIALFAFLFRKPFPKVQDDFFGELNDEGEDLTGFIKFAPNGNFIDIFIHKDVSGLPTKEQKIFFKKIEFEYSSLILKVIPLIEDEVKKWKPDFKIHDFNTEFRPSSLMIPKSENEEWEFGFEPIQDRNHTIFIYFTGFEPNRVHIDG